MVALVCSVARADPPRCRDAEPCAASASRCEGIHYRADEMEVDGDEGIADLRGNVRAQRGNYSLRSDRVRLERGSASAEPRLEADGDGEIGLCRDPDAPVTVGFSSADLGGGDAVLYDPTLRVGGVPVFWLPALALRSPGEIGLLPAMVAWRGGDGLLLGTGLHVPLPDARRTLDVSIAGYVEGGGRVGVRYESETSEADAQWDHLRTSGAALRARGALGDDVGVAWYADAVRERRGVESLMALEPAARRYDRVEGLVGGSRAGWLHALSLRGDSPRGGPLDDWTSGAARAFSAFGVGLRRDVALDVAASVDTSAQLDQGARSDVATASGQADLSGASHWGPVLAALRLRQVTAVQSGGEVEGRAATAWVGTLSLPLVRDVWVDGRPWRHVLEPVMEVGGAYSVGGGVDGAWRAGVAPENASEEGLDGVAGAGVSSNIGVPAGAYALSVDVRGGIVHTRTTQVAAIAWQLSGSVEAASLRSVGGSTAHLGSAVDRGTTTPSVSTLSTLRMGPTNAFGVGLSVETRNGPSSHLARRLVRRGLDAVDAPWLDDDGTTAGADVVWPVGPQFAIGARGSFHVERHRGLLAWGFAGYRHPCGCLAVSAGAGSRLGREGFDAIVQVDLVDH